MVKTSREYQSAYAEFMIAVKGFDIIGMDGIRIHKPSFFDAIYKEHYELSDVAFILKKNVQYLLIRSGHHLEYLLRERDGSDYCEDTLYCEKSREVFHRKAGAMIRRIGASVVTPEILVEVIEYTFKNHHDIEQEIDRAFA